MLPSFPIGRPRRLRRAETLRSRARATEVTARDLIQPLFIQEGIDAPVPIASLPGVQRVPRRDLPREIEALARYGVHAIVLSGISHAKDATGSDALRPDRLVSRMFAAAKRAAPDMIVISDICFCEYTDHGHCGVIEHGIVANDPTIESLGRQAVADAGAEFVPPSASINGQVAAIRRALDEARHAATGILSYSSKFANAFYGPFRAAAGCELHRDRKAY